jgi:transcriptional regulator with XRE-family HTH domain
MSRQVNTTSGQSRERTGFAAKLDEALTGTTSESFARRIDKSLRTVMRWRNGESEPSGSDLVLIARTLDRDPSWFYEHEEEVHA